MSTTTPGAGVAQAAAGPEDPVLALPVGRAVAVSATSQIGAKILHLVLNVVSTLAIVRYLAPADYGVYALVLTVTTLVAVTADFGLPKLAVREICADPGSEDAVVGSIVAVRVVLAVAAIGVSELVLLALGQPAVAFVAASVAALVGVGEAVLAAVVVVFQVRMVQQYEAFVRTGTELLETAAVVALVIAHAGLVWLFVPPAVGTALGAATVIALARWRFGRRAVVSLPLARRLMTAALPIAPAVVIGLAYRKLDVVSVAAFRSSRELGIYSAAVQPVEYAFLTTAMLMNVLFPLMSTAWSRGDRDQFAALYRRGAECLLLVTVALPLLLAFIARPLVVAVYGRDYADAAVPIVLLAVAMVPLTINVWQSLALLVGGFQAVALRYNLLTLVVAAVLCGTLVPVFGTVGAGVAAVGTATFVFAASTWCLRRRMAVGLLAGPLARIGVVVAVTAAVLALTRALSLPWTTVLVAGLVVYVVAVRMTGAHRSLAVIVR